MSTLTDGGSHVQVCISSVQISRWVVEGSFVMLMSPVVLLVISVCALVPFEAADGAWREPCSTLDALLCFWWGRPSAVVYFKGWILAATGTASEYTSCYKNKPFR